MKAKKKNNRFKELKRKMKDSKKNPRRIELEEKKKLGVITSNELNELTRLYHEETLLELECMSRVSIIAVGFNAIALIFSVIVLITKIAHQS